MMFVRVPTEGRASPFREPSTSTDLRRCRTGHVRILTSSTDQVAISNPVSGASGVSRVNVHVH